MSFPQSSAASSSVCDKSYSDRISLNQVRGELRLDYAQFCQVYNDSCDRVALGTCERLDTLLKELTKSPSCTTENSLHILFQILAWFEEHYHCPLEQRVSLKDHIGKIWEKIFTFYATHGYHSVCISTSEAEDRHVKLADVEKRLRALCHCKETVECSPKKVMGALESYTKKYSAPFGPGLSKEIATKMQEYRARLLYAKTCAFLHQICAGIEGLHYALKFFYCDLPSHLAQWTCLVPAKYFTIPNPSEEDKKVMGLTSQRFMDYAKNIDLIPESLKQFCKSGFIGMHNLQKDDLMTMLGEITQYKGISKTYEEKLADAFMRSLKVCAMYAYAMYTFGIFVHFNEDNSFIDIKKMFEDINVIELLKFSTPKSSSVCM